MSQDARWVKAYRDEIDSLRAKVCRVSLWVLNPYVCVEKFVFECIMRTHSFQNTGGGIPKHCNFWETKGKKVDFNFTTLALREDLLSDVLKSAGHLRASERLRFSRKGRFYFEQALNTIPENLNK